MAAERAFVFALDATGEALAALTTAPFDEALEALEANLPAPAAAR